MYKESQVAFSMTPIILDYQVVQWSRICLQVKQGCRSNPCVGEIPWSRKWQPSPVFLPGKFHEQRGLAGCLSWDLKELDETEYVWMHDYSWKFFFLEENCSCLIFYTHGLESKSKPETFILTGCVWSPYKFGKIALCQSLNLIRFCLNETLSYESL